MLLPDVGPYPEMNFLMHAFLSGPEPQVMIGNLLGDAVKGPDLTALSPGLRTGAQLHRAIDSYADAHAAVLKSQKRLPPEWSRVAGILMDVYYDRLLVLRWNEFSSVPLREYLDQLYDALRLHDNALTENMRAMAQRLVETDLIYSYCQPEGIEQALARISARLRSGAWKLDHAMPLLHDAHNELDRDFTDWMSEARDFAADRLANLQISNPVP